MKLRIGVGVMILALAGVDLATAQVQPPQDRINTALARARQVGIPVALLESKIAEGKAKGVSLDRIAAAVERREAALEKAGQALRGQPDATSSLSVGADAVEAGVSEAALKAIAENAPRDRRNVAIAVLTELVEQGHTPAAALERVREALSRGPDALANLPAQAAAARGGANAAGGRSGRSGGDAAPPAGVPAPGAPPQATRPGGPPTTPGRPTSPGPAGR
jgi:ABC-type sugar transport system substrate-binding protein